jgi:hypothetical protein
MFMQEKKKAELKNRRREEAGRHKQSDGKTPRLA